MIEQESPHLLLGRIRFILDCIACFRAGKPLPLSLCYVPAEVQYKICKNSSSTTSASSTTSRGTFLPVFAAPTDSKQNHKKLSTGSIEVKKGGCIQATGEEYCNSYGLWVKLNKKQLDEFAVICEKNEGWILLCKNAEGGDRLVPVDSPDRTQRQQLLFGIDYKPVSSWEQVVDLSYSYRLGAKPRAVAQDDDAVEKLRFVPHSWSYECDEDLVHFFSDHILKEDENLGRIKQYVDSIDVSSFMEESNVWCLTDNNTDTYWESDGYQGQHWIRLHMKKGTIVKKLMLTVNASDDNYLPKRVAVYGGEAENLKKLSEVPVDDYSQDLHGAGLPFHRNFIGDVCVLEDMTIHVPVIEIRIVECRDEGTDVRIRGIKIKSFWERDLGLSADMFQPADLVRYPRLEGIDPDVLYRRALILKRFVKIQDSVLHHLVPAWDHSVGTFSQLKFIKQFLLLSKRRGALINQCLKDSESSKPNVMPRLYINRRLAMEHRDNPLLDPTYKNSVFSQVYEGLKPSDKYEKPLDYRWPVRYDQWWECKFIAEGIIDQGKYNESDSQILSKM